jgi:hypothetical protein
MIFLYRARLAILSQPKTGTTALEKALNPRATIAFSGPPELKHMSYRGFMAMVAPMLESQIGLERSDYMVVTAMREPIDWLGSWYRYRTRELLKDADNPRSKNYTGSMSFADFVRDVCRPPGEQADYAQIKTPSWVALEHNDCIGVDRLFPYEDLSGLYELIEERSGRSVETKQLNVSPEMEISLSGDVLSLIREKFAFEFDLHTSLKRNGEVADRFRQWQGGPEDLDTSPGV